MVLFDVNVLIYAHKRQVPEHPHYLRWLERVLSTPSAFGTSELVLSSFVRIVTNRRVFTEATSLPVALEFVESILSRPNCRPVSPGRRHWGIFTDLCRRVGTTGNLVPDAYLAALAIESGCELITTDRGFARFPGLRWRHPLDA